MTMHKVLPDVVLYGTLGCHLCDDALALGRATLPKGVSIKQIDIVEDENLMNAMATRIPVMKMGNYELNWPFEASDIQEVWRQHSPKRRYLL